MCINARYLQFGLILRSTKTIQEEKIIEVLQVDEKEIEEELEQIKRNAEAVNAMSA